MGLFEHWLVSVVIMLAPPPGDAYNFILKYTIVILFGNRVLTPTFSVISYPLAVVNVFVAGALIHLYLHPFSGSPNGERWQPPIRATLPVAIFFLLSNIYLVVAPFVPPSAGQNVYEHLPYFLHCVVGIGVFVAGAIYWLFWAIILPKIGKYELIRENEIMEDGWTRKVFSTRRL